MDREEKQRKIEECRSSGMTAKAWCENEGIGYRTYINWVTQENRSRKATEGKQRWAILEPAKELEKNSDYSEVRLECGRWKIFIGCDFNPDLLANVLRAVSTVC